MHAPNPALSALQNPAPQAKSAAGGPGRAGAATEAGETGGAVDFASLMQTVVKSLPSDARLGTLKGVQSALDEARGGLGLDPQAVDPAAVDPAAIAALFAEIAQPLAPTAIPLAPVAVAPSVLQEAAGSGSDPAGRGSLAAALDLREAARTIGTESAGLASGGDEAASGSDGGRPAFRLPEASQLAATFAHAAPATPAAAGLAAPASLFAQQPIHSPQWAGEVGQGLVWMARNDVQTAQLSINPPQLGPIEITLSLGKDQATAHFASPHADVREVLQEALPRLREILEGAGVNLGQADVSARSQQPWQQSGRNPDRPGTPEFGLEHATLRGADAVNESAPVRIRHGIGLVDTFV